MTIYYMIFLNFTNIKTIKVIINKIIPTISYKYIPLPPVTGAL